jgi:hypothetical protein
VCSSDLDEGKPKQELLKTGVSADHSGKSRAKSAAADGAEQTGSSRSDTGHTDSSQSLAGHGPTDPGQSPPGNHDA